MFGTALLQKIWNLMGLVSVSNIFTRAVIQNEPYNYLPVHEQCAADSLAPTDAAISSSPGSGRAGSHRPPVRAQRRSRRAGCSSSEDEASRAGRRALARSGGSRGPREGSTPHRRAAHTACSKQFNSIVVSTHPHDCHDFFVSPLAFLSSPSSPPFSLSKRPIRHALHAPCSAPPIHGSRRQRIEMPLDLFTRAPYTDQYQ